MVGCVLSCFFAGGGGGGGVLEKKTVKDQMFFENIFKNRSVSYLIVYYY